MLEGVIVLARYTGVEPDSVKLPALLPANLIRKCLDIVIGVSIAECRFRGPVEVLAIEERNGTLGRRFSRNGKSPRGKQNPA